MKALSIKQPWANSIADGMKTIETRTWSTDYRGPLLIVSSLKPDLACLPELSNRRLRRLNAIAFQKNGPYGCAIAVVRLVGCRPMRAYDQVLAGCNWYEGAIAWLLEDVQRIKPFPVTGRLNLYEVKIP